MSDPDVPCVVCLTMVSAVEPTDSPNVGAAKGATVVLSILFAQDSTLDEMMSGLCDKHEPALSYARARKAERS